MHALLFLTSYAFCFFLPLVRKVYISSDNMVSNICCWLDHLSPFNMQIRLQRASWGLFRDRRPELYYPITTLDGQRLSAAAMGKHCTDVARQPPPFLPGISRPVKVAATQMYAYRVALWADKEIVGLK